MLGIQRAIEIQEQIIRRMELWERGLHAGLVGDAEAEGAAREDRDASGVEEEDNAVARSVTMKLCCRVRSDRPSARKPTGRGEGFSSQTKNAIILGNWLQRSSGRITRTCDSPPWKIPSAQTLRSMRTCCKR